jgi:hypothetical protein
MESIYLIFYFCTIMIAGYAVVSLIFNEKRSFFETISLIMLMGAGSVSLILFWAALLGCKPSRGLLAGIFAVSAVLIFFLRKKNKIAKFALPEKLKRDELIIFIPGGAIILFVFCIVLVHALMMPLYDVDAYGLWGLKAKALFHEGLPSDGLFYQLPLSYSHLNYPLLVPFLITGVYTSIGYVHDLIGKIIFPFFFIGGTCFIFSSLRWKLSRKPALLLTLLFMTLPVMQRWTSAGIADVPLTLFYAGSIFYLVKYLAEEKREDLILSILMTVFCAFVKNEGIAIAAINIGVFGLFYLFFPFTIQKLKTSILFALGIGILMLPWFYWSKTIPHTHENYPLRLLYFFSVDNLARMKNILQHFGGHIINFSRWGILWIILIVAALLNLKIFKQRYALAMWALFIGQILVYIFVFIISPWTPEFLADMALERILLHTAPAAIYLIAFHLQQNIVSK